MDNFGKPFGVTKLQDEQLHKVISIDEWNIVPNSRLMRTQGINTPELITELVASYENLFNIFMKIKNSTPIYDYVLEVREAEFRLQRAWNFSESENYHSYWYQTPHCTCPKMDNDEYIGTSYRITDDECPLHGSKALYIYLRKKKLERVLKND